MKMIICAVRDSAVEAFNIPMSFRSSGEAIRSFIEGCASGDTMFQKRPEHYALYQLGTFDDASGVLEALSPPGVLMTAVDAVEFSKRRSQGS